MYKVSLSPALPKTVGEGEKAQFMQLTWGVIYARKIFQLYQLIFGPVDIQTSSSASQSSDMSGISSTHFALRLWPLLGFAQGEIIERNQFICSFRGKQCLDEGYQLITVIAGFMLGQNCSLPQSPVGKKPIDGQIFNKGSIIEQNVGVLCFAHFIIAWVWQRQGYLGVWFGIFFLLNGLLMLVGKPKSVFVFKIPCK